MSVEENKALVRRWLRIFEERRLDAVHEVLHPSYGLHGGESTSPWPTLFRSLEEAKRGWEKAKDESLPFTITVDDMVAEGDKVALRETWYYEGKPIVNAMVFYRICEGKIIDDWFCKTPLQ